MATHNQQQEIGCQIALAALVVVACIAAIPPIVDAVVQSIPQSRVDAAGVAFACRACGVVEDVREVTLGAPTQRVSTITGEGFAMFFGLLTGKLGTGSVKIYEVEVLLQDGSVRVIREGTPPAWKAGDRVKVVTGQIKSMS